MADATPPSRFAAPRPRADRGSLWDGVVAWPVRTHGWASCVELNVLPARSKICSFDCPYCACGHNTPRAPEARWPSPDEIAHHLRRALERLPAAPEWVTLSGNGEPTLHPRFPVVVDRVLAARDAAAPRTRVAVLSNGLTAAREFVRAALRRVDERVLKLDPGPPERVSGIAYDVERLARSYRDLKPLTVQALVVRGPGWDAGSREALAAWLPLLSSADPDRVRLSSLDRPPADPAIRIVPRERLDRMAQAIREALPHCVVEVY
jgi:wyosine [tRNA(Phe)-imidazoG37] synthetase (radical SAM superfamily)